MVFLTAALVAALLGMPVPEEGTPGAALSAGPAAGTDTIRSEDGEVDGREEGDRFWEARFRFFPFVGYGFRSRIEGVDFVGGAEGLDARAEHGLAVESVQGGIVWARIHEPLGLLAAAMRLATPRGERATLVGVGPGLELPPEDPDAVFRRVRGSLSLGPAIVRDGGQERRSLFLSLDAESPLSAPNLALHVGFSAHFTQRPVEEGMLPSRFGVVRAGIGLRF